MREMIDWIVGTNAYGACVLLREMLTGSVSLSTAKWARRGAALDADQREGLRIRTYANARFANAEQ